MKLFKSQEEREAADKAKEAASRAKAYAKLDAQAAKRAQIESSEREKLIAKLISRGLLKKGESPDGLSNAEIKRMLDEDWKEKVRTGTTPSMLMQKEIQQRQNFLQYLDIQIKDGFVRKASPMWDNLGSLAGAHADVTEMARQHRAGLATTATIVTLGTGLGPTGALLGLSKKYTAAVIITFPDGTVHTKGLSGVDAIRRAQAAAASFNALAGTS